jgi:propanediol dehydratase small subunit
MRAVIYPYVPIVAILFFATLLYVLLSINTRRILSRFLERACTGPKWRRRFPEASKSEIREFLDIFTEAFGFKQSWRLCFTPDDRVMDIYRTLYPGRIVPDHLELESLVMDLQKKYRVDILASWREDITLADLFAQTRRAAL